MAKAFDLSMQKVRDIRDILEGMEASKRYQPEAQAAEPPTPSWEDAYPETTQGELDEEGADMARIERLRDSLAADMKAFEAAWSKYKSSPLKNKPQLANAMQSITSVGTQARVASRALQSMAKD